MKANQIKNQIENQLQNPHRPSPSTQGTLPLCPSQLDYRFCPRGRNHLPYPGYLLPGIRPGLRNSHNRKTQLRT